MKLDQLTEEVPTKAMEAYLSKYLIQPKMTITMLDLSEHGLGEVETNEATVEQRCKAIYTANDMNGPWSTRQSNIHDSETLG